MPLSLVAAGPQTFSAHLGKLDGLLGALAAFCAERRLEPAAVLAERLYPDMFSFIRQVQLATDFANRGAARLAGAEPLSLPDEETTIEALKNRIARVQAFLADLPDEAVEAGAEREITFRTGPEQMTTLPGATYLTNFAIPNFYFHMAIAYAILRRLGVPVGKRDYLAL